MVTSGGIATDEFAQEACQEQLSSQHHHGEGYIEIGTVGHEGGRDALDNGGQFDASDDQDGNEAQEEHDGTEETEDMHGLTSEDGDKPQRQQVQIAVDEAVEAAELRLAKLASLMVHHLFGYLVEAGILGQIGHVAVHLAIDLDILYHLRAVGLEAAVEIVEVVDAADLACRGIEEFGGYRLGEGVVALLLIAGNEVVAVLDNHAIEFGDFIGRVLQVGIHGDDHAALAGLKATVQGGRLAVVATELDAMNGRVGLREFLNDLPRAVGAAIVDKDDFVGKVVGLHHANNPSVKFGQAFFLIIEGYNNGNINNLFHNKDRLVR